MSDIEVRHLSKSFDLKGVKVEALKDINLSIKPGDIYGIIGLSLIHISEPTRRS